jgi:hypothetical protein
MTARPPRVRPRFVLPVPLSAEEVLSRTKSALAERGDIDGLVLTGRIELVPDRESRHFWSPQLTVDVEAEGEGSVLRGRFGPHPHVWTLYMCIHAIGAFATVGSAMFGISQYLVGQTPWALFALPAAPVLAALVWALAFVGQGLGAEQMYALRRFLEESLGVHG